MALPSDLIDLLVEFDAAKVEYLLVGGHAVAIHGNPRFTKDADVWVGPSEENIRRATLALERFGAPPKVLSELPAATGLDVVWMGVPPARIDLMKFVPGGDFSACYARRIEIEDNGIRVSVIGRDDLVRLKEESGRPQDLEDARRLRGRGD